MHEPKDPTRVVAALVKRVTGIEPALWMSGDWMARTEPRITVQSMPGSANRDQRSTLVLITTFASDYDTSRALADRCAHLADPPALYSDADSITMFRTPAIFPGVSDSVITHTLTLAVEQRRH